MAAQRGVRGVTRSQKYGCQKTRSSESTQGQRPTGQANDERWGKSTCPYRGSRSHQGGKVTHQVPLRGDTHKDEVIPNSNLLSF